MLDAHVDLVEPLGADTLAYGSLGAGRIAARLPGSTHAHAGRLALRFERSQMHFFDAASGRRIEA
jgi:ABC-type sugar transport system ATPase subunit